MTSGYPIRVHVALPVFNEGGQLAENAHKLAMFLAGQFAYRWEIVIADNGSTDRTWAIAQALAAEGVGG